MINGIAQRENDLRAAWHKLDALWMRARSATGQERTDLHKEIGSLRIKLRLDRAEMDALRQRGNAPLRDSLVSSARRSNQSPAGSPAGSDDEDLSAGPKE